MPGNAVEHSEQQDHSELQRETSGHRSRRRKRSREGIDTVHKRHKKHKKHSRGKKGQERKGHKHKAKDRNKQSSRKRKKRKRDTRSSSSDASSSVGSSSSTSVDVATLQALLQHPRGLPAGRESASNLLASVSQGGTSSMLSFLPPVSTGHKAGLQLDKKYRGFRPKVYNDKDAMGRVLVDGHAPALSNLEALDKLLHGKEERD